MSNRLLKYLLDLKMNNSAIKGFVKRQRSDPDPDVRIGSKILLLLLFSIKTLRQPFF